MSAAKAKLAPSTINRIARFAHADPRTVRKVIAGHPVRGLVGDRIVEELRRFGIPAAPPA